jgi:hypothetical protein
MTDAMFAPLSGRRPGAWPTRDWRVVVPVPSDAPPPPAIHPTRGVPAATWTYRDRMGAPLGYVCRFNNADGTKDFVPLTWCLRDGTSVGEWRWRSWGRPRPLYGLDHLADAPDAPVVVCEGEKAADAAAVLLPRYVAVTSPNGARSAAKSDWTALARRQVIIWPDADEAGQTYARDVAAALQGLGVTVRTIMPASDVPSGWDAADALVTGWTPERAHHLIAAAASPSAAFRAGRTSVDGAPGTGGHQTGARHRRAGGETSPREHLIALADAAELWHFRRREAFATVPVDGHHENWSVRSREFQLWLTQRCRKETGTVPSAGTFEEALRAIEAKAIFDGRDHEPCLRVAEHNGAVYVDLCDSLWRAVEIDPSGWRVIERCPVKFVRSAAMAALPDPVSEERGIELLRPLINVATDDDFTLIVAFIVGAFNPHGPFPVLLINGEQGSAKSTTARIIQSLIDPSKVRGRALPRDVLDLSIAAQHSYALFFDNVSGIADWLSDGFARLATGAGFTMRRLYSNDEEQIFTAVRPICLNGIPDLVSRADLADRSIAVTLATIAERQRRTEKEMFEDFKAIQPAVLGALYDAVSAAQRNRDHTVLPEKTRMADFELFVTAAETALGCEPGTFGHVYRQNRADAFALSVENDPVASAVTQMMQTRDISWEGTAAGLLDMLDHQVSEAIRKSRRWPHTPRGLSDAVTRATTTLRQLGIYVSRDRAKTKDRQRLILIDRRAVGDETSGATGRRG